MIGWDLILEQAAEVDVAPLADTAEASSRSTGVLPRRQPEPARKLSCASKCVDVANGADERGAVDSPIPGIVRRRVTTGSASARARSSRSLTYTPFSDA
jgi:hypothetical protein